MYGVERRGERGRARGGKGKSDERRERGSGVTVDCNESERKVRYSSRFGTCSILVSTVRACKYSTCV